MSEQITIELFNRQQAWAVMNERLFPFLKTVLQAGGKWVLTVKRQTRTNRQNLRYWSRGVLAQVRRTGDGKRQAVFR